VAVPATPVRLPGRPLAFRTRSWAEALVVVGVVAAVAYWVMF